MRLLAVAQLICALMCGVVRAQTPSELAAKFGRFDGKGYLVAPGVRLTVTYGDDQRVCSFDLQPKTHSWAPSSRPAPGFPTEIADQVLEKMVPVALRKGVPQKMLFQSGCVASLHEEYGNVSIGRITNECGSAVESLVVHWKRPACDGGRR